MKISVGPHVPAEEVGDRVSSAFQEGAGFVHLQTNLRQSVEDQAAFTRNVSQKIGQLTLTDDRVGSELWKLDNRTSPHTNFVPYHTDNSFMEQPENIVGFWCHKASTKGGEHIILPVSSMSDYLISRPTFRRLWEELTLKECIFSSGNESHVGSIIDQEDLSIRYDLKYMDERSIIFGKWFQQVLQAEPFPVESIKLSPGDALYFDNIHNLHARTPYNDSSRISTRVRLRT